MKTIGLPPKLSEIADGKVTWKRLEAIDYEALGYFLSCHLIIEHYLDEHLKACYPDLDWNATRLTFNHKISLLSNFKISDQYDCIPAIKHINSLRNKLSHNIDFKITDEHLKELVQYLKKSCGDDVEIPSETIEIMAMFTTMVCTLFAGYISATADSMISSNKPPS